MLPYPLLVDEVRIARGSRTILVGEPHRDPHDDPTAGAQPLHRLYVVHNFAVVSEPLVLFEPHLPGKSAPGSGVQVLVGVVPVLQTYGLVIFSRCLFRLSLEPFGTWLVRSGGRVFRGRRLWAGRGGSWGGSDL